VIRSKGVGVYFVTQNPLDVPDTVSSQLGNRVQHALRAFTPMEQKAVKAAATTFRANPAFNTEKAIMELGVGEALVSTLDAKGQPTIVERTLIRPPNSRVGPVTDAERKAVIKASPVVGEYDEAIERESAYEILQKRTADRTEAEASAQSDQAATKKPAAGSRSDGFWTAFGKQIVKSVVQAATRMAERAIKDGVSNAIKRGTFGGIKRGGGGGGFTGLS
jgi:DNA helicase HerA-like ATPase